MKKLQKEFTGNYDKVGMNKFVQIKKENGVAIYQRFNTDGTPRSYEVFIVKVVPKGASLPNGKTVEEPYEQYPGANAFGKTAYDCRTIAQAEERFEQLVIKAKDSAEAKEEAAKTGVRNRGRRGTSKKVKLDMTLNKGTKFTAKFLMSVLGVSQPVLFPILKQWEKEGSIKVNGTVKGEGKGRPATEYIVV